MAFPILRAAAAATVLPLSFAGPLAAQIPLGGTLSGSLPPAVYHTTSSLSVAVGQTLTLGPGVIIKFTNPGHDFTVDGTLLVNGTSGAPVILTDDADDSAGGDTNGDGPSTGSPIAWRGILFRDTADASSLDHFDVRYGGYNYVPNVTLAACNARFTNCTVREGYSHGMNLSGDSFPTVTGCTFTGNGGFAIENVPFAALRAFANNTAAGNYAGRGNFAHVTVGGVASDLTLGPTAMISGALVIDTTITVAQGATLTLLAGVNCKFRNASVELTVLGTLRCNGTAGSPVVFTDDDDDSAGGDTNGDGPSTGAPLAWRGIAFADTADASALDHTDIRYGGYAYVANLQLSSCDARFTNCIVRDGYSHGMNLGGDSFPTVTGCTFTGNGGFAVENVPLAALRAFANNTAAGNYGGRGNFAHVTVGGVASDLTLGPTAMIGGALVTNTTITVAPGATLTLLAGVNCKFRSAGTELTVLGTLRCNGTAGSPVVFTDDDDDSAGGDTNGDGPSTGAPLAWRGIAFADTADASALNHTHVRYGGYAYLSNLHLVGCNATFTDCTVHGNYTHGMNLSGDSYPTVTRCTFTGNGGAAVENVPLAAVPGFTNNTAAGNVGNFLHVTSGAVTTALTIGPQSMINGGLMMAASVTVAPAATLTVLQGTIFKFQGGQTVTVDGAVDLRGTTYEPVVFTDDADDAYGGDTNSDGPSSGQPLAWSGFVCTAQARTSRLENVVLRFGGYGYVPGLTCASPNVALRAVRVDRAYSRGFALDALAGDAVNLVAWGCGSYGIHATAGNFDLVHATCTGNVVGIQRESTWYGSVVNSIAWGNGTNLVNFGSGAQFVRSDGGFAGSNGNLDTDPRFVDLAAGDLHLQATSPCLGAADLGFAVQVQKDHDENSRVLDHRLNGVALPDMGAFELPAWDMVMEGVARPGALVTLTVTGPAGFSFWILGLMNGTFPVNPFGILLAGLPGPSIALLLPDPIPTGLALPFALADDPALVGAIAGIQTLSFPVSGLATGNFTRLLRALVRP